MATRRHVLKGLAATTALTASPVAMQRAFGAVPGDARFVVVILRGGMDGLAAVAPYGDRAYRRQRGDLAMPGPSEENGLRDLDGFFGLHPSLAPLHPLFANGELAIAHAVGTQYRERSHFDAQNVLENGTDTPHSRPDGWLNRAIAALDGGESPVGLSVGANVPLIIRGPARYSTYAPQALPALTTDFVTRLEAMYRQDPVLATTLDMARGSQAMQTEVLGKSAAGMARNRRGGGAAFYREALSAAGKLLGDAHGPRIAVLDTDGWDTHAFQGTTQGALATQLGYLSEGLTRLQDGLGAAWRRTAVIVITEFGRTAAINGTKGTDHGTGGVALLLGGAVAGGRVVTPWPGLDPRHLYDGRALAPATDLRSVLKGMLRDHLGIADAHLEERVFPDSRSAQPLSGLIRT